MTHYVLTAANWLDFSGLTNWLRNINNRYNQHKAFKETVQELSKLSDSELRDIGLSRCDIYSIAMEKHYDSLNKG